MDGSLLIKGRGFAEGYVEIASPGTTPLRWLALGRLGVLAERPYDGATDRSEVVLNLLAGDISLEVGGVRHDHVAQRPDPFDGPPTFICLPPDTAYRLTSHTPQADLLLVSTPLTEDASPVTIVRPPDAPARSVGAGNWTRTVWPGTAMGGGTRRLMVGETLNPPGNWSSYPPHKHDVDDPPRESVLEEAYFFLVKPAGGFGIQRIYERRDTPDALDEVYVVRDGDTVIIPRGYHPVVAAPGYQLGYVWALCGHGRRYGAWTDDPAHAWLHDVEPILRSR